MSPSQKSSVQDTLRTVLTIGSACALVTLTAACQSRKAHGGTSDNCTQIDYHTLSSNPDLLESLAADHTPSLHEVKIAVLFWALAYNAHATGTISPVLLGHDLASSFDQLWLEHPSLGNSVDCRETLSSISIVSSKSRTWSCGQSCLPSGQHFVEIFESALGASLAAILAEAKLTSKLGQFVQSLADAGDVVSIAEISSRLSDADAYELAHALGAALGLAGAAGAGEGVAIAGAVLTAALGAKATRDAIGEAVDYYWDCKHYQIVECDVDGSHNTTEDCTAYNVTFSSCIDCLCLVLPEGRAAYSALLWCSTSCSGPCQPFCEERAPMTSQCASDCDELLNSEYQSIGMDCSYDMDCVEFANSAAKCPTFL